jgi:hypothetical protein
MINGTQQEARTDVKGPVFVVGCPRSGTTLLQRMLDAHPSVAIAGETHFMGRFWLRREEYGDLTIDASFARLLDDIVAIPEFADMRLDPDEYRCKARLGKRSYAALFELLLSLYRSHNSADLVGEKTPDHLVHAPALVEFFPSARFVHIIRDPRAVVNSWRNVPWASTSTFENAEIWYKYMRYAWRFPKRIQQCILTVSYEALVKAPAENLDIVCRFLGLQFEPGMLRYHETDPRGVSVSREPWKITATKPLDTAKLDRWRSELSPAMIAIIEGTVWREMKRRGYDPQTGLARLLPAAASATVRRFVGRVKRRTVAEVNRLLGNQPEERRPVG